MSGEASDRYTFLSSLCGTAAFRLPPPIPEYPSPYTGDYENLLGVIPDHLLPRYLCFEPSSSPHSTTSAAPLLHPLTTTTTIPEEQPSNFTNSIAHTSSSGPLLPCSNIDCSTSDRGHQDNVVHEQQRSVESLPPCVVNYQDSVPPTPEGEGFSVWDGDLRDERPGLLLSAIKELALWRENYGLDDDDAQHIVSVMSRFRKLTFAVGYSERLLSQIKDLALWREGVVLDDDHINHMVTVTTKLRKLVFSKDKNNSGYKSDLSEPSRKKQRCNSEVKSNMMLSLNYFTRCKSSNADAATANSISIDLDYSPSRRDLRGRRKSQVGRLI